MNKVIWLTGLPCAGKTTIGQKLVAMLPDAVLLDGDVLRKGLCSDLGFLPRDRDENIRRVAHVARILWDGGKTAVCAFISPRREQRALARSLIPAPHFAEVFVDTPPEECERRDTKGMWAKARNGDIKDFTGVSAPYEPPEHPEVHVYTTETTPARAARLIALSVGVVSAQVPHDAFVGRWSPFHLGHLAMMEQVWVEKARPLLVLVRDTPFDPWPAETRKRMVDAALEAAHLPHTVCIIPDVASVNYGRGVGYAVRAIDVPADAQEVSGTDIRRRMQAGDRTWREFVPPGVVEVLEGEG